MWGGKENPQKDMSAGAGKRLDLIPQKEEELNCFHVGEQETFRAWIRTILGWKSKAGGVVWFKSTIITAWLVFL